MSARNPKAVHHAQDLSGSWKIHTPNLLRETLGNHGAGILSVPMTILADKLAKVAERAMILQDRELLKLCCDLTLFEESDPSSPSYDADLVRSLLAK